LNQVVKSQSEQIAAEESSHQQAVEKLQKEIDILLTTQAQMREIQRITKIVRKQRD